MRPDLNKTKRTHTLYLGGEYLIVSQSSYFKSKYKGPVFFVLEDTIENVLGDDWETSGRITTLNLLSRLKDEGKTINDIKEPVLYGKIKEKGSVFMLAEVVLLSEIAFTKSITEFEELKKRKKIVELKI